MPKQFGMTASGSPARLSRADDGFTGSVEL
jgi:hypothetical protein